MFQQKPLNITLRTKWNRETTYIIRPYKSDNYSFFFHAAHQCLMTWCQGWNPLNAHFWRRPDNRYGVQRSNVNRRGSTSSPTHPQQLLQDWYAVCHVMWTADVTVIRPPRLKAWPEVCDWTRVFIYSGCKLGRTTSGQSFNERYEYDTCRCWLDCRKNCTCRVWRQRWRSLSAVV